MPHRHLTLVIPQLPPGIIGTKNPKFPTLNRLLARAKQTVTANNFEQWMFELFSLPLTEELPIAAITGQADGLNTRQGYWLRADPVELRADLAAVYIMGNRHLDPTTMPNAMQVKKLKTLLALDAIEFYFPQPTRWYFRLGSDPQIKTYPLEQVIGKDISRFLPSGIRQSYWRKLLTEIQMMLHQEYAVAYQYGQCHEGSINGVWLWGAGQLPHSPQVAWQKIWSEDILTKGLGLLANILVEKVPSNFENCLAELQEGDNLVVLGSIDSIDELERLESNWFQSLVTSLRANKLSSLDLYLGDNMVYRITSRTIRYFWRI